MDSAGWIRAGISEILHTELDIGLVAYDPGYLMLDLALSNYHLLALSSIQEYLSPLRSIRS